MTWVKCEEYGQDDSLQLFIRTVISLEIYCLWCLTVTMKWELEENQQKGDIDRSMGPQSSCVAMKLWYLIEKLVFVLFLKSGLPLNYRSLKGLLAEEGQNG